ncbi:Ig-like domain-containing protein [Microbacterium sp. APC 3901]|uniref:Ig-like domain-containing protein n=1 Tax=Microbacterium sp. APC 3901 TaxID=3035192 RepID=UPI0025B40097|nr:Ig-like domain-containing protein [Microbacterium sp. APC 3901]MDN3445624.1 Ig-like domain-containing protein [Microbacterium sp. APC 3901]
MSTDDERPDASAIPRTRAELRAAREAEAAASRPSNEDTGAARDETPPAPRPTGGVRPTRSTFVPPDADSTTTFAAHTSADYVPPAPSTAEDAHPAPEKPKAAKTPKPPKTPKPAKAPKPEKPTTSRDNRFLLALGAVLGILVLVGAGLGVVSLTQGPRITEVQVDPTEAIETSGSRVILTANQSLAAIDESQVTVEPAVPFTLDAAGRGIGIRFTVPLDDDTEYTVNVADAVGAGGGPSATLSTSFSTPSSTIFLLRRDVDGDDKIFRTDLSGQKAQPVFAADKINDFRATSSQLVVSVEEDEGSKLLVMGRDGSDQRELELPGVGYVGAIQVSDRGGLVGYSYSDKELSDTEGRASVLVTQSLSGDDEPVVTEVGDKEANVFVWQFVPDSAAMLFIDFDGALSLVDRTTDAGVQSLGLATTIQGISRGTYTAIVERLDGSVVELNLTDGSEVPLEASTPDYGSAITITPFPGGTLRHVVSRDENGLPIGQAIVRVDDEGAATPLVEVDSTDSILQACASPSGQYAAVVIAPELADNPYDQMLLPLPENLETHLLDLRTGDEIVALTGFDASWCQTAPQF